MAGGRRGRPAFLPRFAAHLHDSNALSYTAPLIIRRHLCFFRAMSARTHRAEKAEGAAAGGTAPEPSTLPNLPPETMKMILWHDDLELADLYYIRFACRSLRAAAVSVIFQRVKWLAVKERDFLRMLHEFDGVIASFPQRLSPTAVEQWEREGLEPLLRISAGRLLCCSKVPPDHIVASKIFCHMTTYIFCPIAGDSAGRFLRGLRACPDEMRLLLQTAVQDSHFKRKELSYPSNTNGDDEDEQRYFDPLTVIIRDAGLLPQEMLEAVPSPVYLGFEWYYRVLWELEDLPERTKWTKELALEQLPRVLSTGRTFSPRMPDTGREVRDLVLEPFFHCSGEAIAAVLVALGVAWPQMWELMSRARAERPSEDLALMDIPRALFGPNDHDTIGQNCSEFFLGMASTMERGWFASHFLQDEDWPVSMSFQIWDFLPPCDPREFDTLTGNTLWGYIMCGTAASHPARMESYLSMLLEAAPENWTHRMQNTIFEHFDDIDTAEKYAARRTTNTQPDRIRCVARALGDPVDSIALLLLRKIAATTYVSHGELLHFGRKVANQLLGHSLTGLEPDRSLRLEGQLLEGALPDGKMVESAQRVRLVDLVRDGTKYLI